MFERGKVVYCKRGRDRGGLFVIVKVGDGFIYIADGKRRKLETPKKKNMKHVTLTKKMIPEEFMVNDKRLRREINNLFSDFNDIVIQ